MTEDLPPLVEELETEMLAPEEVSRKIADLILLGDSHFVLLRFAREEVTSMTFLPDGWSAFVLGGMSMGGGPILYVPRGGKQHLGFALEQTARVELMGHLTGRDRRQMSPLAIVVVPDALDSTLWAISLGLDPALFRTRETMIIAATVAGEVAFAPTVLLDGMKIADPSIAEDLDASVADLGEADWDRLVGPTGPPEEQMKAHLLSQMLFPEEDERDDHGA